MLRGLCTPCPNGLYQSTACQLGADRICTPLTPPCNTAFEFESVASSDDGDRQCSTTLNCTNLEFQSQAPTLSTDRSCSGLTICQSDTEFEDVTATPQSDRICARHSVCDAVGVEWESTAPTTTTSRVCSPVSGQCQVSPGIFQAVNPSITTDRACQAVTDCFNSSAFSVSQYREAASTSTSDAVCRPVQSCDTATQYVAEDATPTTDRNCTNLTACAATEFERVSPTATTDRLCLQTAICIAQNGTSNFEFESSPPNATTDRVCLPVRQECSASEYEAVTPTVTSDRQCLAYVVQCNTLEFQSAPRTLTTDAVCTTRTTCGTGTYTVPGTVTADTNCPPCDFCRGFP